VVASRSIAPGCVQFLGDEKRFHTAWTHSGHRRIAALVQFVAAAAVRRTRAAARSKSKCVTSGG